MGRSQSQERIWTRDFTLVCLTSLSSALGFQFLLPILPLYMKSLGGQEAQIGLILGIYSISALASRMVGGRALDILGRKIPLVIGAFLFMVAMPLYGITTTIPSMLLLRLFHGVGFGVVGAGIFTLAADLAPAHRRGEALGYFGNMRSVAMAVGSGIAVSLLAVQGLPLSGFSLVFAACTLVAALSLIFAFFVRETGRHGETRLANGGKRGIASFFCAAAVPVAVAMLFGALSAGVVLSFVPIYLSMVSTQIVPAFFFSYAVAMIVSRPFIGRVADRVDRRKVAIPLMAFCSVGVGVMAIAPSLPVALVSAIAFGLGFGSLNPVLMALVVDMVKSEERGTAMATFSASMDVGIAAGSSIGGVVAQLFGYRSLFLSSAAVGALGIVYFLGIYRRLSPQMRGTSEPVREVSVMSVD